MSSIGAELDVLASMQMALAAQLSTVAQQTGDTGVSSTNFTPPTRALPGDLSFDAQNAIDLPAAGAGDVEVLRIDVPLGMNGEIKRISNNIPGGVLEPASGKIIWKLLIDGRPIRNYDNITVEKGSPEIPRIIDSIFVSSGQKIQFMVNHVSDETLTGKVICSLAGVFYPAT